MVLEKSEDEYKRLKHTFASSAMDVASMKEYLAPYIDSPRQLSRLTSWPDVFHILEVRDYLDSTNVKLLLEMANRMGNTDLANSVKSYDKFHGEVRICLCGVERSAIFPTRSAESNVAESVTVDSNTDLILHESINNVAAQIGENWRVLVRKLGVIEGAIDNITRLYPTHADQAKAALKLWLSSGNASLETLVTALRSRHCKRKGIGEHLLQKPQYVIIEL